MHTAMRGVRWAAAHALGLALLAGCATTVPAQGPAAQVSPLASSTAPTEAAAPAGAVAPIAAPTAAAGQDVSGQGATAATAAREALAAQLNVSADTIQVTSVEAAEWPDACLGVTNPDEMCAAVITPGYIVMLEAGGQAYTYHTDATGNAVKAANAEQPGANKGAGPLPSAGAGTITDTGDITGADAGTSTGAGTGTGADAGAGASAAPAAAGGLQWTGPAEIGSGDTSQCAQMSISNGQATLTGCDGAAQTLPLGAQAATFDQLVQRLAPFALQTATETVTFQGAGAEAGPAWQRAVLAWARVTHAELASGRTSATARTAMSWNLGPLPDQADVCAHLTVLDYGYAYAEQRPCQGGDATSTAQGWLENAELEQFDRWLYANAPLYDQDNYLNGVGAATFDPAQLPAVEAWAKQVWTRLAGTVAATGVAAG